MEEESKAGVFVDPAAKYAMTDKCYVTLVMANGNVMRFVGDPKAIEECMEQFHTTGHFTMDTSDGSTVFAMTHAIVLGTVNTRQQIEDEAEKRKMSEAAQRLTAGVRERR